MAQTAQIYIEPKPTAEQMCKEVNPHLATYWNTPEQLATQSLGVIQQHLIRCKKCQQDFNRIADQNPAPWNGKAKRSQR